jgi:molybdenum cofactor synthesis domain-containing protein
MLKIAVITVSDRAFSGEYDDRSGPAIRDIVVDYLHDTDPQMYIVPDEADHIRKTILENLDKDFIITTGGTGLSLRDITPDITRSICEREIPGIAEMLRRESYKETKNAVLSRGYCGMKGKTIVINLPGSEKGAMFCARLIVPLLEHANSMLLGEDH